MTEPRVTHPRPADDHNQAARAGRWTLLAWWVLLVLGLCFWLLASLMMPAEFSNVLRLLSLAGPPVDERRAELWLDAVIVTAYATWGWAAFWVAGRRLARRGGAR
jgi:hypothetical protein